MAEEFPQTTGTTGVASLPDVYSEIATETIYKTTGYEGDSLAAGECDFLQITRSGDKWLQKVRKDGNNTVFSRWKHVGVVTS